MKSLLLSGIFMLALSCGVSREPRLLSQEIISSAEQINLVRGANRFGLDLFREITNSSDRSDNIFISPLSIHTALTMAWNGAETTTRNQMAEIMYFPKASDKQINEAFRQEMARLLLSDPKVKMDIANSIWYRKGYNIKKSFLDINRTYFSADINDLDFSNPKAKDLINAWVAENTNNKIKQIVDDITPEHIMFLINAVYFKGLWEKEFKEQNTRNRIFYIAGGAQKQIMTMEMTSRVAYAQRQDYRVIELPYGNGNFSMVVVLPDVGMDVNKLIRNFTVEEWDAIGNDLNYIAEMNIRLPRFKFSYETELKQPLMKLGIKEAFIPELANFSGITDMGIYISRVRHKTFLEVNEEGTEAAAVTSIEFRETAMPAEPLAFHVDRPFIFAIREKTNNTLLFIGKVMDPEKN